jgi:O-antigen/teichoic acid export membrane protein
MATIRKQAIISGLLMYAGFAIGALNVYFLTHFFRPEQYGLTRSYMDFGQTMFAFASFGTVAVLYKFSPYYISNLSPKKNDLLAWVLSLSIIGFILVSIAGYVFEPFIIRKFSKNAALFITYYYWVFPFGLGILLFGILEAFSLSLKKAVLPTFLKEIALRILTSIIIGLYLFKLINFQTFIYTFSFTYLSIAILLLLILIKQNDIHLHFAVSKVSRRLWKKMLAMQGYFYGGTIIIVLKDTIDGILIGGLIGLDALGVFALAQYAASLIQAPQRSMLNVSVGIIAQAWKDKDLAEISRVYSRSCINMFIMSAFMYGNVVLNTEQAIHVFKLDPLYLQGIQAMIVLGLMRVIDAGTGVNNIVIQTSNRWRFDFYSGLVLLALIMPLNYFLIKRYGIIGSAYAQLISFVIYNAIRFEFIRREFKMQPFNSKTFYSILLSTLAFALAYVIGTYIQGLLGIFARGIIFSSLMIGGVFAFKLTPDAHQLWEKWKPKTNKNADNAD